MNNEEKSAEFFEKSAKQLQEMGMDKRSAYSHAAIAQEYAFQMAQWKDKQFSDRVEMTLCIDCHEFESCDNCPKYQIKKELLKL